MISYARFGKLRLATFRPEVEVAELENWEYKESVWVGEAVGFSEWLRLAAAPKVLRSLALAFDEFPPKAAAAVLEAIDLPLRPGMGLDQVKNLLGDPTKEHRFASDRVSYDFVLAGPPRYHVECTLLNDGGLNYLVVMRPTRPNRE